MKWLINVILDRIRVAINDYRNPGWREAQKKLETDVAAHGENEKIVAVEKAEIEAREEKREQEINTSQAQVVKDREEAVTLEMQRIEADKRIEDAKSFNELYPK